MIGMGCVKAFKWYYLSRLEKIRLLAEDDSLLGAKETMGFSEERYMDDDEGEEVPPPLPPRPTTVQKDEHEVLIDLEEART